jgi:hypothetical protein
MGQLVGRAALGATRCDSAHGCRLSIVIIAWLVLCWLGGTYATFFMGWTADDTTLVVLVVFWTGAGIGWVGGRLTGRW